MGIVNNFRTGLSNFKTIIGSKGLHSDHVNLLINGGHDHFNLSKNSMQISTVYTCLKILAETMARLPLEIYKNDPTEGKVKFKDHRYYNLLHHNVNNYTTSNSFINVSEVQRGLTGNSFAKIYRKTDLSVDYIEVLHPSRVKKYRLKGKNLQYLIINAQDKEEWIGDIDILHFKTVTKDGVIGTNPIEALRLNLSTTWEGMSSINEFYKNQAINPKAIKSVAGKGSYEAMLETLKVFEAKYGGLKGAGKMFPLPPNTEIQELQMNPIDVAFLTMIGFNRTDIAALYGVPPHLVGELASSKYNNIEQTQISFKVNTIAAIARMYRQELEHKLLTTKERNEDGVSIEFNLNALVEADYKTTIEGLNKLFLSGSVTPNEIARLMGFPIYLKGGDYHYMQQQLQAVETRETNSNTK